MLKGHGDALQGQRSGVEWSHTHLKRYIPFLIVAVSCAGLTACQGTEVGGTLERAIAPLPNNSVKSLTTPADFAPEIPLYPKTNLQSIERVPDQVNASEPKTSTQAITTRWTSIDSASQIIKFYGDAFSQPEWRILVRSPDGNFVAQKADLLVTVAVQASAKDKNTTILLQYLRDQQVRDFNKTIDSPAPTATSTPDSPTPTPDVNASTPSDSPTPIPEVKPVETPEVKQFTSFTDIQAIPSVLRPLIIDLHKLGVISAKQNNLFKPDALISRREYVRWLVQSNNRLYQSRLSRQIRLAESSTETPAFVDVSRSDPDFRSIQALVNTGLVSVNPASSNRFRPGDPLTREELLQLKVPLDLRSALPLATVAAVKQAWGFQDSDRLSPGGLRAVLGDFQGGDLSNIRRSFGYTTLFQPRKYVTRAEAAAALWFFGTPNDGLSAQDVLEQERSAT